MTQYLKCHSWLGQHLPHVDKHRTQGEEREEAMMLRKGKTAVGCAGTGIPGSTGFLLGFQTQASTFLGGLSSSPPPSE